MDLLISQYVVTAILAVYGTIVATKWKEISKIKKSFSVLTIIGALLLGYNTISEHLKKKLLERIAAEFVVIENDKQGSGTKFSVLGSGTTIITKNGVFVYEGSESLFKVDVVNGEMLLTAVIWDPSVKPDEAPRPLLAIFKNECTRYSKDFEFNNDDNGYEIVTKGDRHPYFQVDLKGGITYLSGVLHTKTGLTLTFCPAKIGGITIDIILPTNPRPIQLCEIDALFLYPREAHLGERAKK